MLALNCVVVTGFHDTVMQAQRIPQKVTPHKPLRSSQMNSSFVSPFNTNVLMALGRRPSPSREEKEELFGENSLGVLSEVAQYHSELSGAEGNSSLETPVRERLANIKLMSTAGKRQACSFNLKRQAIITRILYNGLKLG